MEHLLHKGVGGGGEGVGGGGLEEAEVAGLWLSPVKDSKNGTYHMYSDRQTDFSKQCRPRWDTTESGVSSGSTLFVTHPAIFRHNIG